MSKEKQYNLRGIDVKEIAVTFMGGEVISVMGKCCHNCKYHTGSVHINNSEERYRNCDKLDMTTFEFDICDGFEFSPDRRH